MGEEEAKVQKGGTAPMTPALPGVEENRAGQEMLNTRSNQS